uniref:Uncharacterized protein n=1 Tax=Arundo donax TaxID=35708 RepID=A0A0A9CEV1_ARUDO
MTSYAHKGNYYFNLKLIIQYAMTLVTQMFTCGSIRCHSIRK